MQVDHHSLSIFFPSSIFILFLHFTLPHLISFFYHPAWCLTWVQHPHFILVYSVCPFLYHHVLNRDPEVRDSWFFYALHLMHEGYEDYIIGIFEPSFLSFISPYCLSLCYVPCLKTTLRPWFHTLYLTAHTWVILKIGWRLFLRAWWMRSYDIIYTGAYLSYQWWIFRGDMIYTGAYPTHRWQFSFKMMSCTEA